MDARSLSGIKLGRYNRQRQRPECVRSYIRAPTPLDAIVSGRWPVAAVVAYSGRLASPRPFVRGSSQVLLLHGGADPVIPAANSTQTAAALRETGFDAEAHILPGVGHTITAQGAQLGADFIAKVLAA